MLEAIQNSFVSSMIGCRKMCLPFFCSEHDEHDPLMCEVCVTLIFFQHFDMPEFQLQSPHVEAMVH